MKKEAVLLGSAILGAVASGYFANMPAALIKMTAVQDSLFPRADRQEYHLRKYRVFREMYRDQLKYRNIMHE